MKKLKSLLLICSMCCLFFYSACKKAAVSDQNFAGINTQNPAPGKSTATTEATGQIFIAYYITDGRNLSFKLKDIPNGVDMVILFGVKYWQYLDTLKYPAGTGMMSSYKSYGAYFNDIKACRKEALRCYRM